jgi:deoxyadenosine/deoxycytidine kinase
MNKKIILLAGNIGSGKTTLSNLLGERFGWQIGHESVADNPYLPDFYADMARWGFHLQMYFLGHRAEQYLALATSPNSVILDRSIYEDATIFARGLHQMGNLNDRDYAAYTQLYSLIIRGLPRPDLLIYLDAPVPFLLERIAQRGRAIEAGISGDYLAMLNGFYHDWIAHFDDCPVLTIHSQDVDALNNAQHLDFIAAQVTQKLGG